DPYLRTIARALERLGTEVEHASIDRRQLASALGQLLAHSRQAYAQNGSGDGAEVHAKAVDLLAAARDNILPSDRSAAPPQPNNADAAAPAAAQQAAAGVVPPASSSSRPQRQARPVGAVAPPLSNGAAEKVDARNAVDEYGDLNTDARTQKERAF